MRKCRTHRIRQTHCDPVGKIAGKEHSSRVAAYDLDANLKASAITRFFGVALTFAASCTLAVFFLPSPENTCLVGINLTVYYLFFKKGVKKAFDFGLNNDFL